MKIRLLYIIPLFILIAFTLFLITLFHESGTTDLNKVKIENELILNESGSPMNGKLLGKPSHINQMLTPILELFSNTEDWQKMSFGSKVSLDRISEMEEELRGFTLKAKVRDGKLTNKATIWYNLRTNRNYVFGYPIEKTLRYFLAYLFHNQIKIAEVNFEENQLSGEAIIFGVGSGKHNSRFLDVTFQNNVPTTVKRYHDNGNIKRINRYKLFVKDGLQQEFHNSGDLTYEVTYELGKKRSTSSYYWTKGTLRKSVTYDDFKIAIEKHFFPDGSLARVYQANSKTELYSNGDIKSYHTQDSTFSGMPSGTIETYHDSGLVSTQYNYDNSGILNGPYQIFYKSGKLWETGTYFNGQLEGSFKKWFTNERIAEDHQMVSGNVNGPFIRYYDSGVKWKEYNYNQGTLTGKYQRWWKNGQLAIDCMYENDIPIICRKWGYNGMEIL